MYQSVSLLLTQYHQVPTSTAFCWTSTIIYHQYQPILLLLGDYRLLHSLPRVLYHLCSILTLTGGGGASGILSGNPVSFCQFLWPDYSCDFLWDFNSFQLILSSHSNLVLWQEVQRLRGQAYYWRRRVGRISIWTDSDGLRHSQNLFWWDIFTWDSFLKLLNVQSIVSFDGASQMNLENARKSSILTWIHTTLNFLHTTKTNQHHELTMAYLHLPFWIMFCFFQTCLSV